MVAVWWPKRTNTSTNCLILVHFVSLNIFVLFVKMSYMNMLSCFPNLPRDKYAVAYSKEGINRSNI